MLAHLIKGRARKCEHASDEAIKVALSIKFPTENITIPSTRSRSSSSLVSPYEPQPKKLKQSEILSHTYRGLDIPFTAGHISAIKAQCLRAVISTGSSFGFFEDPEVMELFRLMRTAAPACLPSRKVIGGSLLNDASSRVQRELENMLRGKKIGLVDDGWKGARKEKLDGVCANVDFKVCHSYRYN